MMETGQLGEVVAVLGLDLPELMGLAGVLSMTGLLRGSGQLVLKKPRGLFGLLLALSGALRLEPQTTPARWQWPARLHLALV